MSPVEREERSEAELALVRSLSLSFSPSLSLSSLSLSSSLSRLGSRRGSRCGLRSNKQGIQVKVSDQKFLFPFLEKRHFLFGKKILTIFNNNLRLSFSLSLSLSLLFPFRMAIANSDEEKKVIESAHTTIMMSSLTARLQGGSSSVAKEIRYADRAPMFRWRPR